MTLNVSTTALLSLVEIVVLESELAALVTNISNAALRDQPYNTIVYMSNEDSTNAFSTDAILRALSKDNGMPVFRFSDDRVFSLRHFFNREFLVIVKLASDAEQDHRLLQSLWQTFRQNRQSRLILLLDAVAADVAYVEHILQYCSDNKAINAVAILSTVLENMIYYDLTIFPEIKVNTNEMSLSANLFPTHVRNMHNHPLKVISNQIDIKSYTYKDNEGHLILSGYIGKAITEFARKHNAILTYPLIDELGTGLYMELTESMVRNNTYDMAADVTLGFPERGLSFSDVYDYMDWCIMVPMEKDMPSYLFYVIIFDYITLTLLLVAIVVTSFALSLAFSLRGHQVPLADFIFNANIMNGYLGQSYNIERKFAGLRSVIHLVICLAGIIFNSTYTTYLQTFNARAPTEAPIRTLQDIRDSGMKMYMFSEEVKTLKMYGEYPNYKDIIEEVNNYNKYFEVRDSFDRRYVYPVPGHRWIAYEEQQQFFARPAFRISDICIVKGMGMVLPLQDNSVYLQAMNVLIGQLNNAGLVEYWKSSVFLESVRLGKSTLIDLSVERVFEPMKLEDMYLLMIVFGVAAGIISICFFMEMYWPVHGVYSKRAWRKLRTYF